MENQTEDLKVETLDLSVVEAQDRAAVDVQIATAKKYPRNLERVKQNIIALVTMDEDTAKTCGYALPRQGKTISGPTVHLARMIVQQYGNIRIDANVTGIDNVHVTAQATCLDLENNVGIRVSVKRRITDRNGSRFNDDMVVVTGNAATAIALRNAVFSVIPKALVDVAYKSAQQRIIGDISTEAKIAMKRKTALDMFLRSYGVDERRVLQALGLREITEIGGNELVILHGMHQSILDGDTTVDELFFPDKSQSNLKQ